MKEMVGGCCVCSDDRGWSENPLVYCDGQSCTVAVHQACYGIVTVPTGPWYCRKCESQERTARVKCELCPSKYGALKRTDNSGWAHVVCALYIPEVRFGNVTTMEPILLQLIPTERFNKVCYICEEQGKATSAAIGACMQCNKTGCKQQFHVTCAQALGLLCEEAGNYLDNVKYCGYCQHHYSKLRKGGNVKPIPPYKPVSTENHLSDSNSEKEADASNSTLNNRPSTSSTVPVSQQTTAVGKRNKSSSGGTTRSSNLTSRSTSNSKSTSVSSAHQKSIHSSGSNSGKNTDKDNKVKVSNSNVRSSRSSDDIVPASSGPLSNNSAGSVNESESKSDKVNATVVKDAKSEISEVETPKIEIKESKGSKKKKNNSRTPTPNTVLADTVIPAANLSVLIPELSASVLSGITGGTTVITAEKRELKPSIESTDKIKKIKLEQNQNPPVPIVLTSSPASLVQQPLPAKSSPSSPQVLTPVDQPSAAASSLSVETAVSTSTSSIVQSPNALTSGNSLVVSVPLSNTNLGQHSHIINNQTSVVTVTPPTLIQDRIIAEEITGSSTGLSSMTGGMSGTGQTTGVITTEMSGGGLKILYEKQQPTSSTLRTELERSNFNDQSSLPSKRSRSMSSEKSEKGTRGKKTRASNAAPSGQFPPATKRASRSQHPTSPPVSKDLTSSANIIPANEIKESPPSSPGSESQTVVNTRANKAKGRRSAPASTAGSSKDNKDAIKIFQNGVNAPHMLGNQLNPNSNMAQKMSDHLNSEMEAHSCFNSSEQSHLIGPQLHHRVLQNARSSSTGGCSTGGSSTTSGGSGFSMLGGSGGSIPQTLDQLLERQWEQGSQFLMEQAQHFDIASLLSCLHQLRAENLRLEEHVSSLLQRRDHLLAVNARLAIPLTNQPAAPQAASHSHTVNNIHPSVVTSHSGEMVRSRHSGGFSSHSQVPMQQHNQQVSMPIENGLPPEQNAVYPHQHRSPAGNHPPQSSSNLRHSPAGSTGYPNSGLARSSGDRPAPRPQPYGIYQGPGPSNTQSQMVIRRDSETHHQQQQQQQQSSSKTS